MQLLEVEKFVALRGALGCPLSSLSKEQLEEATKSRMLEIVKHSENVLEEDTPSPSQPFIQHSVEVHHIEDIDNYEEYDIRMELEKWRAVIFGSTSKRKSPALIKLVTLLLRDPNGITRKLLGKSIPNISKNLSKWLPGLEKEGVLILNGTGPEQTIKYNYGMVENGPVTTEVGTIPEPKKQIKKPNDILSNRAIKIIQESGGEILLKDLRALLGVNQHVANQVIYELESQKEFEIVRKGKAPLKIVHLGSKVVPNGDMLKFLLDMCLASRIFVLSDLPKEIKKMKSTLNMDDNGFLNALEDNGFGIIEIRSRFIATEYVVFSDSVDEDDRDLLQYIEKSKVKIQAHFRSKVKNVFLKNAYLFSFDNNYSPYLKERVMLFYKFALGRMSMSNDFFVFDNDTLLQMSLATFVKCVPLRFELQFMKTVCEIAKKNRKHKEIIAIVGDDCNFDELEGNVFEELNLKCLEAASQITLGVALDALKPGAENYNALKARVNIYEFDRILHSLLKYNIFEGFVENGHLYFEKIDGIESYVDRVFSEIKDESTESTYQNASYLSRKKFYEMVCELSQEEFDSKSRYLIEKNFEGGEKEFFLKKLQSFK